MPTVSNDGDIPFGAQVLTINAVDYVAEEIDFEEKTTSIIRRNEINVPSGAIHIKDLIKGKMTLQLDSVDTAIPENQSQTTLDFRGSPKVFIITDVSQPQKQDQIHKIKVDITEALNPGNITES